MQISRQSQGTRAFALSATDESGSVVDLSQDAVEVAIVPIGNTPNDTDWIGCSWSVDTPGSILVNFNVGGGFQMAQWALGVYEMFVRPHHGTEVPVLHADDYVEITR